jgi:hypothetical protein
MRRRESNRLLHKRTVRRRQSQRLQLVYRDSGVSPLLGPHTVESVQVSLTEGGNTTAGCIMIDLA